MVNLRFSVNKYLEQINSIEPLKCWISTAPMFDKNRALMSQTQLKNKNEGTLSGEKWVHLRGIKVHLNQLIYGTYEYFWWSGQAKCQQQDRFQEDEEDYQEEEEKEVPAQAWTWNDYGWTVSRDITISSRRDQENDQRGCGTSCLHDAEEGVQEAQEVSLQEQQTEVVKRTTGMDSAVSLSTAYKHLKGP